MKKFLAMALAASMALSLVSCAKPAETTTPDTTKPGTSEPSKESTSEPLNLVFATCLAPTDPFGRAAARFCQRIGEISDGMLTVDCYDGGTLYNQDELPAAFREGKIDMADFGMEYFENAPQYTMFKSAYIFDDAEHAMNVYNGELGDRIFDDIAEKVGVRGLGASFYSTRQINLSDADLVVETPDDMHDVLLRMPGGNDWTALGLAIGANPVPVTVGETYMALKTGMVDGQDNGFAVSKGNSFDEVTKQVIITDHLVWCLGFAVNEARWQTLTDEQKGWIQEAADEVHQWATDLCLQEEADLVADFEAQGIVIHRPDKQPWIDYAAEYYKSDDPIAKELTADWDWDLYDEVRALA